MGLVAASAKLLLDARVLAGVDFSSTLTLGHQTLNLLPWEARRLRNACRHLVRDAFDPEADLAWNCYADAFLRAFLGVRSLDVLDASGYQQASLVHDLNVPVPPAWDERYDVVIDGGTLEHVFNVPVALDSYARMTRTGGTLFLIVPANNFCGHGFYQFSPELLFRWCALNGLDLRRAILTEHGVRGLFSMTPRCYEVSDPAEIGRRADLFRGGRTLLMIEARKIASTPGVTPQQSDYVATWEAASSGGPMAPRGHRERLKSLYGRLPPYWRHLALEYSWMHTQSFRNRRVYKRLPYLDFSKYPTS